MTRQSADALSQRERLGALFDVNEQKLRLALDEARASFDHRGIKGDVVEGAVRTFLRGHLQRVFDVGTGEVIDQFGHRSPQLDVVVSNSDQPFAYPIDASGLYLAEGVSAVGEVKSKLNSASLQDILTKGQQIRQIRPRPLQGDEVYGNPVDIDRYVMSLPYFAIAIESDISTESILKRLADAPLLPAGATDSGRRLPSLDMLVVLDRRMTAMFVMDGGSIHLLESDGSDVEGWGLVHPGRPLTDLFLWLNTNVTRVRRHTSIAIPYLVPTSREELDWIREARN
ncbi:DUF6602 domain-containing protein [Curtobacterium sp. MCBD17_032]|uniref:DUF6602 domain-containing protein n=1 Tax=Curtobacterium sp. MCBD17_032 TaxID=2175659 RepID=UPI0011B65DDD|nr:DUF6602 domain-containing protein [Curtobacterium sp. MCBD17_032]